MAFDAVSEDIRSWSYFDADWYLQTNTSNLSDLGIKDVVGAKTYYYETGARLRHSPNPYFDERWYLTKNPDVAKAVAEGRFSSGFEHYGLDGHKSRSPHWLFSEEFYLSQNPDLTRDFLEAHGYLNGYDHYLRTGDAEFRNGHWLFDPAMHHAATVLTRSGSEKAGEFSRFLADGGKIGSTHPLSWYFDPIWYLATYPDVKAEIEAGAWSSALEHYLANTWPVKFDPNEHFSEEFYQSVHVDVVPAVTDGRMRNFFEHFLRHGAAERRKPHPLVDLREYFSAVAVQTSIEQGHYRDAFAHFRSTSGTGGPTAARRLVNEEDGKRLYTIACENLLPSLTRNKLDFRFTEPHLSVIIVAFNKFAFTMSTLASLRSNYAGEIQVILVDSGSRDEIGQIEQYVLGLEIIRFRRNIGFIEGCNTGLKQAKAKSVLFLNNDVQLNPGAIQAGLARLWASEKTGAVGAKVIRTHGRLQEAGSIIWRDGWVSAYLRDQDPNVPEANFVRTVDFCSGVFLLAKTGLLHELNGFDVDYGLAYFEEADLCIRLRQLGFDTIYDPSVSIQHYEYSTTDISISSRMMEANHPIFRCKNAEFLQCQSPNHVNLITAARAVASDQRCILFIEDRLPFRKLGSGFTRSNDIIQAMVSLGHQVTLYPIYKSTETIYEIYKEFPDTVEIIYDRELPDLEEFLSARSGYYDAVWIARTHNAERLLPILRKVADHLPIDRIVIDTEAVAATRNIERWKIQSKLAPEPLEKMVEVELSATFICQRIIAVNELDAKTIQKAGFRNVDILGHMQQTEPSPRDWEARRGILFFGSIHDEESPNLDGLRWFVSEVLPLLDPMLPPNVAFSIAGHVNKTIDLTRLGRTHRVELLGEILDLGALYDRYRVMVAPTRFAGGIPYKLHESAAHGLPIVTSHLLQQQLGWQDGVELLSASIDDPLQFAERIMALYDNEILWSAIRENALAKIRTENNREGYVSRLAEILSLLFK